MTTARCQIAGLYRYPVKGLSATELTTTALVAGETIALDRAYAIENGPGRFDPANPRHLPKISFLMLMRDERLATLETKFDDATHVLTILRAGKQVARGDLKTRLGCSMIEQFLAAYMKSSLRGAPRIVRADDHSFSDVAMKCLHVVNLATVRDLERIAGRPINPLRFRANLLIDGAEAWSELKWLGRSMSVGDARLEVVKRTQRCDATNVDPSTGARDMALPAILQRQWGHSDFGVYARIATGGTITVGDALTVD